MRSWRQVLGIAPKAEANRPYAFSLPRIANPVPLDWPRWNAVNVAMAGVNEAIHRANQSDSGLKQPLFAEDEFPMQRRLLQGGLNAIVPEPTDEGVAINPSDVAGLIALCRWMEDVVGPRIFTYAQKSGLGENVMSKKYLEYIAGFTGAIHMAFGDIMNQEQQAQTAR